MPRLLVALLVVCAACDPDAWSPRAERARAARDHAAALAAHLEALPGVARASVVVDAPAADPLAPPAAAPPPRVSIVLALAPGADATATELAARDAALASVRDLAPADLVVTARPAPRSASFASVGPFEVSPRSRAPLIATLAAALVLIAGLAAWIAVTGMRARRRRR